MRGPVIPQGKVSGREEANRSILQLAPHHKQLTHRHSVDTPLGGAHNISGQIVCKDVVNSWVINRLVLGFHWKSHGLI